MPQEFVFLMLDIFLDGATRSRLDFDSSPTLFIYDSYVDLPYWELPVVLLDVILAIAALGI